VTRRRCAGSHQSNPTRNRETLNMRALCGAIITAGAVIGLGLTAQGFGARYHSSVAEPTVLHLYEMDKPLVFILVFLTCVTVVGLGVAFFGLAYHHHRRHHEMLRTRPPETGVTTRTPA
jgi:hypothetical protein